MNSEKIGLIDVNNRVTEEFDVSEAFEQQVSTVEIFNTCFPSYIRAAVEGVNVSVFHYGATGAGKDHTMVGKGTADQGLVNLISENLFEVLEQKR